MDPITQPTPWSRRDFQISLALTLFLFGFYLLGACRTIYVGDSGELVTAVWTLGIPHPSSYPLYVLLGKLWATLFAIGTVSFRLSAFSALGASLSCAALFGTARSLSLSRLSAVFSALLLAFSPSFWSQANIQRVYALNALFVILVLWATAAWYRNRKDRSLLLAALLCGLGASNHTFMALMVVPVGLFALSVEPALIRRGRLILQAAIATIVGLLPYLYLPLRSRQNPRLDWGNPETLSALKATILREDFWHRAYWESWSDLGPIAADFLGSLSAETLGCGWVLAVLGTVVAFRRGNRFPLLPSLVLLTNFLAMAFHGSRSDIFLWHRYYIPSYLCLALLAGYGVAALKARLPRLTALLLIIPVTVAALNWQRFDRSDYRIAESYSRTLLDSLPPGAHLAASDDNILFVLIYLHLVEGVRPDVDLIMQGIGGNALPSLSFDPDQDPLFFTHHPNWNNPEIQLVIRGLTFQTTRPGTVLPPFQFPIRELEGTSDSRVPKDYLTQNLMGEFHYMAGLNYEQTDWLGALREFQRATELAPTNDVLLFNLALVYRRNGRYQRSLEAFQRSAAINPRHIPSNNPVRPLEKVEEAKNLLRQQQDLEAEIISQMPELRKIESNSEAFHRRMATELARRGHGVAARGHELAILEKR